MPQLPASVRVALWATTAWREGEGLRDWLPRALPDVDHLDGDTATLELWPELGERALLVALPAPGDLHALPHTSAEAVAAATEAGECLVAPGLGGLLVPVVTGYGVGSGPDAGTRLDFAAYDAQPVPRHRVEALDGSALERHFREELVRATEELDIAGGTPFAGRMAREVAEAALDGEWGLPDGLPPRAHRVLRMAGAVSRMVEVAGTMPDDALDVASGSRRRAALTALGRSSERTLADATNACVASLAGWVPARG